MPMLPFHSGTTPTSAPTPPTGDTRAQYRAITRIVRDVVDGTARSLRVYNLVLAVLIVVLVALWVKYAHDENMYQYETERGEQWQHAGGVGRTPP